MDAGIDTTIKDVVSCLPEEVGEVIRTALVDAGIDTTIKDAVSCLPEEVGGGDQNSLGRCWD